MGLWNSHWTNNQYLWIYDCDIHNMEKIPFMCFFLPLICLACFSSCILLPLYKLHWILHCRMNFIAKCATTAVAVLFLCNWEYILVMGEFLFSHMVHYRCIVFASVYSGDEWLRSEAFWVGCCQGYESIKYSNVNIRLLHVPCWWSGARVSACVGHIQTAQHVYNPRMMSISSATFGPPPQKKEKNAEL